MSVYTTEIASDHIVSDNPIHQRLLKPYIWVADQVYGDLLEIGCGEGRGISIFENRVASYTAVDKIESVINQLKEKHPSGTFIRADVPPFTHFSDNQFDCIVSFQVIEHIKDDTLFVKEIARILKPGGKVFLTTPNRIMSLSRNPWHIREYIADELSKIVRPYFSEVSVLGIDGDEKVMKYHEDNRKSVEKIMKWDVFDLQYKLPASLLRIPYEWLNRMNRNKLQSSDSQLVKAITHDNYLISKSSPSNLDLLVIATK